MHPFSPNVMCSLTIPETAIRRVQMPSAWLALPIVDLMFVASHHAWILTRSNLQRYNSHLLIRSVVVSSIFPFSLPSPARTLPSWTHFRSRHKPWTIILPRTGMPLQMPLPYLERARTQVLIYTDLSQPGKAPTLTSFLPIRTTLTRAS